MKQQQEAAFPKKARARAACYCGLRHTNPASNSQGTELTRTVNFTAKPVSHIQSQVTADTTAFNA